MFCTLLIADMREEMTDSLLLEFREYVYFANAGERTESITGATKSFFTFA